MASTNLFIGNGEKEKFAREIYNLLMKKKWVTYADVMEIHTHKPGTEKWNPGKCSLSSCDYYTELKKAFSVVRKEIRKVCGEESILEDGNNRNKRFCYVGSNKNPLEDMLNAKAINDLRTYWDFCQDSAGFFPTIWLETFFKDTFDLLHINKKKQNGKQIIYTSMDRSLTNIEYLPYFHKAITCQWVLKFTVCPFGEEPFELVFHPHCLKEFNGRWFVLGKAEGTDISAYNVALDRIASKPVIVHNINYQPATEAFYKDFFDDIVGVTHKKTMPLEEVVIHTQSAYIHGLMITKPIHKSQKEMLPYGEHDNRKFGEIAIKVRVNMELIGRILTYGTGLEVIRPQALRNQIIEILKEQMHIYLRQE